MNKGRVARTVLVAIPFFAVLLPAVSKLIVTINEPKSGETIYTTPLNLSFTVRNMGRVNATIYNPNSYALTNYQVRINLSNYTNILNSTYIAVYDTNGALLPFCYEQPNGECNTTPSSVIWVKVPSIPANGTTTIIIQPSDSDVAVNGDKVFDFYDDFSTDPNTNGKWTVYRSADNLSAEFYWDSVNKTVYLTKAVNDLGVMAFFSKDGQPIQLHYPFIVEFRYLTGGGSGADGMAFAFDKNINPYVTYGHCSNGGTFGLAAYNGSTNVYSDGYAIELDNFKNPGDPSGNHIAVVRTNTYQYTHLAYYNTPATGDNTWHILEAKITNSSVKVYLDGKEIIDYTGISPLGYGYAGVGAGTGGLNNNHILDWIRVRKYADQEPVVSLTTYTEASEELPDTLSYKVLVDNATVYSGELITDRRIVNVSQQITAIKDIDTEALRVNQLLNIIKAGQHNITVEVYDNSTGQWVSASSLINLDLYDYTVHYSNISTIYLNNKTTIVWSKQYNPDPFSDGITSACGDGKSVYFVGWYGTILIIIGQPTVYGKSVAVLKVNKTTGDIEGLIHYEPFDNSQNGDIDVASDCIIKDGYLYLTGVAEGSRGFLSKINPDGLQRIADYDISITGATVTYPQVITTDGEYLYVAGYTTIDGEKDIFIEKINPITGRVVGEWTADPMQQFGCRSGSTGIGAVTINAIAYYDGYLYIGGSYSCVGDWNGDGNQDTDYRTIILKVNTSNLNLTQYKVKDWLTVSSGFNGEYIYGLYINKEGLYAIGYYNNPQTSQYYPFVIHFDFNLSEINSTLITYNYTFIPSRIAGYKHFIAIAGRINEGNYTKQGLLIIDGNRLTLMDSIIFGNYSYNAYIPPGGKMYLDFSDNTLYVGGYDTKAGTGGEYDYYAIKLGIPRYADTLNYNLTVRCGVLNHNITVIGNFTDGNKTYTIVCDNKTHTITDRFRFLTEGNKTVWFKLNAVDASDSKYFGNETFIADLNPPEVNVSIALPFLKVLTAQPTTNISIYYNDSISPAGTCYLTAEHTTFNNTEISINNNQTVTKTSNLTNLTNGKNALAVSVECKDLVNHTTEVNKTVYFYPYNVSLRDEMSDATFPANNVTIRAISGDNIMTVTGKSQFYLITPEPAQFMATYYYGDGSIFREIDTNTKALYNVSLYLVDVSKYTVVQYEFDLDDPFGLLAGRKPYLIIYGYVNNSLEPIYIEPFDAQNKANTYLVKDKAYKVAVVAEGGFYREFGWLYPSTAGQMTLTIRELQVEPSGYYSYIHYKAEYTNGTVKFYYEDTKNETISLSVKIYANGKEIYSTTLQNPNNAVVVYQLPANETGPWLVYFEADTKEFGNITGSKMVYAETNTGLLAGITPWIATAIASAIVLFLGTLFPFPLSGLSVVLAGVALLLLNYWGLIQVNTYMVMVVISLAFMLQISRFIGD